MGTDSRDYWGSATVSSRVGFFMQFLLYAHFHVGFFWSILPMLFMGIVMINVEVNKDVPLPEPKRRYPYKVMEVGESFLVAGGRLQVVCNANYRAGKKLARKFIARREEGGVRVWRVN